MKETTVDGITTTGQHTRYKSRRRTPDASAKILPARTESTCSQSVELVCGMCDGWSLRHWILVNVYLLCIGRSSARTGWVRTSWQRRRHTTSLTPVNCQ